MKIFLTTQHLRMLLLAALSLVCLVPMSAQTKAQKIDDLMKLYHKYDQFNGSVLVAENGELVYADGFGMANFEHSVPNRPDTKHRLASITKQFTADLILQLVEQGKLELDKPISTYLPEYTGPAADKVNIHQLLTHSSGIPSYTSFPDFFERYSRNSYTPDEFVQLFADSTLVFNPGERFSYNNSGYFLLGKIIEEVSGKTYEQMLKENIFDPTGMKNSGFDHHGTILKNRAAGYERDGKDFINAPYLDMSVPYAAGSLYSTVEDLYLWDQALHGTKILNKKSKELMFSPHIEAGGGHYGYGWGIGYQPLGKSTDSVKVYSHSGGIHGFNTLISRYPKSKNFIVLLNNTGGTDLGAITMAINAILHRKEYEQPKQSIARALLIEFDEKGTVAGVKKYEELKELDNWRLDENHMNSVGYELLQQGKTKEAIEVFKINVAEFPDSWNVYDSLGEAYLEDGQKKLGIENYRKSVQLNPENENAVKIIEKNKEK